MASETSELTFVRCPSCRSLVPASATRCRICNNPLDSAGKDGAAKDGSPKESALKGDDSDASRNASRVRQKTMSASPDEVATALTDARAENAPEESDAGAPPLGASSASAPVEQEPVAASSSQTPAGAPFSVKPSANAVTEDLGDLDPLGAYLEELDGPGTSENESIGESKTPSEGGGSSNLLGDPMEDPLGLGLLDDLDDNISSGTPSIAGGFVTEPERAAPLWAAHSSGGASESPSAGTDAAAQKPIVQGPMGSTNPPAVEAPFAQVEASPELDISPLSARESDAPGTATQKYSDGKVQSSQSEREGRPPFGERSDASAPTRRALNFGAPVRPQPDERKTGPLPGGNQPGANQPPRPEAQRSPERGQEQRNGRDRGNGSQRDASQPQGRREENRREENKRDDNRRDSGNRFEQRVNQGQSQQPRPQDKPVTSGPKAGKNSNGKLFGWLVSYAHPEGRAVELREGRFFITAASIKGSDLIVEDPSISTPHALVVVSAEKGLHVQDLMSERGVFVRAQDGADFEREEGSIALKHGDWVRFGDVEYVVSLAAPGPK